MYCNRANVMDTILLEKRPFSQCTLVELKNLYEKNGSDIDIQKTIFHEIAFRKSKHAIAFRSLLIKKIAELADQGDSETLGSLRPVVSMSLRESSQKHQKSESLPNLKAQPLHPATSELELKLDKAAPVKPAIAPGSLLSKNTEVVMNQGDSKKVGSPGTSVLTTSPSDSSRKHQGREFQLNLKVQTLHPAASDLEFRLHEAALAWRLVEPIVIDSEDDVNSRKRWADDFHPFRHQIDNLFLFCRRLPVTLIADEVGLGKTISAGLVIGELMERRRVQRVLILAPKVLGSQWQEELETKFNIEARAGSGKAFDQLVGAVVPVVITTYETIRGRGEALENGIFDMLVLDEAHKLRNLYPNNPPQVATSVREALEARKFKYVVMLTATPMQNRLWDLYSLVDCLAAARGMSNPFGPPALFDSEFCADTCGRKLREGSAGRLRGILQEYICRSRKKDIGLLFPSRNVKLEKTLPSSVELQILQHLKPLIEELPGLSKISLLKAFVSSPVALARQIENMSEKRPNWTKSVTDLLLLAKSPGASSKLKGLLDLIERLRQARPEDWRVIVFTERVATLGMIVSELDRLGIKSGTIKGGQSELNRRAIEGLRASPPHHHVVVSTDAGAEGVNLQAANVLVNIDMPWNPMKLEQRIGRVQRLGSTHANVEIVNFALRGTFDEYIIGNLTTKLQTVTESLGEIESILGSIGDEEGKKFEDSILEMIERSLAGQDVTASRDAIAKSIDDAKRRIEEEGRAIEDTLGDLRHLHRTGARPPDLAKPNPGITLHDFVNAALTSEGFEVATVDDSLLTARSSRHEETFSLSPEMSGKFTPLYPGSREFERLIDKWSETAHLRLAKVALMGSVQDNAARWLQEVTGATLTGFKVLGKSRRFAGSVTARASVANAFDRYEKLVNYRSASGQQPSSTGEVPIETTETGINVPVGGAQFNPAVRELITRAVLQDPDVNAFGNFYRKRGEEEATKPEASGSADKIREEHDSIVQADVVSMNGKLCAVISVALRARIDKVEYLTKIVLDCGRNVMHCAEQLAKCSITGRIVPERWLATSPVSGAVALRHKFSRCEFTGAEVLPAELIKSQISGKHFRGDQVAACVVTGREGHSSEFLKSDLSGRPAIAKFFQQSEESGRQALQDEMTYCAWTGKHALQDEVGQCGLLGAPIVDSMLEKNTGILEDIIRIVTLNNEIPSASVLKRLHGINERRFANIDEASCIHAPRSDSILAIVRLKSFFGLRTRYALTLLPSESGPYADTFWASRDYTKKELVRICDSMEIPSAK